MSNLYWWKKPAEPTVINLINSELDKCKRELLDHEDKALYHSRMSDYLKQRMSYLRGEAKQMVGA